MTTKEIQHYYNCANVPLTVLNSSDLSEIHSAEDKIILFDASWSGPSRIHIKAILQKLNELDTTGLRVFYIDIDTINVDIITQLLGRKSQGNGEAVFIRSGRLVASFINDIHSFLHGLDEKYKGKP